MVLSIIIPTLNNESQIIKCLDCLMNQTLSRNEFEIIVSDGGSKDKTRELAKKYGAKIIDNVDVLAEPGVNLGMNNASGNLLMIIAVDNFFYDKKSLEKIIKVFENKDVYAAFPKHASKKSYSLFTKYINTFTDPFNHFVYGYASNARSFSKIYPVIEKNDVYSVYDFLAKDIRPIIAFAQGFTIRSSYRRKKIDAFDDQKSIIDLITLGKKIAYVHSVSVYHDTIRDVKHFMKKQRWATRNVLQNKNYGISHRTITLTKMQFFKVKIWPLYSLTFIGPFIMGIINSIRFQESLWLLHPLMCLLSGYSSFFEVLVYNMNRKSTISRQ